MLKNRAKGAAGGRMQSANEITATILKMEVFNEWCIHWKTNYFLHHYGQKMDKKKHQLEQVQQMFKTFATQLEQGIGNTPRSQRKGARAGNEASRPPLPSW